MLLINARAVPELIGPVLPPRWDPLSTATGEVVRGGGSGLLRLSQVADVLAEPGSASFLLQLCVQTLMTMGISHRFDIRSVLLGARFTVSDSRSGVSAEMNHGRRFPAVTQ